MVWAGALRAREFKGNIMIIHVIEQADQCENCDMDAVHVVYFNVCFNGGRNFRYLCDDCANALLEKIGKDPGYIESCPNCGCKFGVN